MSDRLDASYDRATEDRVAPAVAYALYLLSIPSAGILAFIGLIVAYASRNGAGPRMATHYAFLIRTFWLSIWWVVIGWLLVIFGVPLSFLLVGLPFLGAGILILSLVTLWFAVRLIIGIVYLAQDQPHPRPNTWLF